jgi:ribonuclease P protein component
LSPEHGTAAGAGGASGPDCGFGFPKRYRLTKTDEYSSVFGFRRTLRGLHFLLHYRPRETVDGGENRKLPARLGVVVPKKLVKAAVRRNLIKRLAREQFRLNREQLPSLDLVLRLATKPGKPDRKGLATEILELLRKVGQPRSSGKRN